MSGSRSGFLFALFAGRLSMFSFIQIYFEQDRYAFIKTATIKFHVIRVREQFRMRLPVIPTVLVRGKNSSWIHGVPDLVAGQQGIVRDLR